MSTIAVHTPPMPSPASSMVAAGATTFSVLAAGDPADVPVVFLHGAGPGVTAANTWGDILAALASTARCIAPDLPGYGRTVEQAEPSTGAVSWIEHSARAVVSFLAAIDHEVLIVHGADNPYVSAAGARYFAEHLPNAQLHVLERCAHYPQLEHPALCAALLAGFLTPA